MAAMISDDAPNAGVGEADTIIAPSSLREPRPVSPLAVERYTERGVLGVGGMGEVKLVRDEWLGRDVAQKTLRSDVDNGASARARFLREIRVQGQLEHPSIVPVYDIGSNTDGEVWFTMRRVHGRTLADVLRGLASDDFAIASSYSRRKLLSAFANVCLVLQYAHTRGVIHRDLKPSNIMLGDFGAVYILDWGIAKILGTGPADDPLNEQESTGSGRIIGTLGYMSPEQVRGGPPDPRTDVYALGVILFEILTLQTLQQETNARKALAALKAGLDACASRRAPNADIPPELDAICMKAAAPNVEDRYASAKDLSDAIEAYLDGDRDLERRREIASDYLQAAERTVLSASQDHTARVGALKNVLRAVALAPEEPGGVETLAKLLLDPPSGMPVEAKAERQALDIQARSQGALLCFRACISYAIAFPLMLLAGIRSWILVGGGWLVVLAAAAFSHWAYKTKTSASKHFGILLALCSVIALVQGTWLGPFVLMPAAVAMTAAIFTLYASDRERPWVLVTAVLVTLLPFVTELIPGLERGFTFEAGNVVLRPRALHLPPLVTTVGLVYSSLAYVIVPAVLLTRLKASLKAAEDKVFLQAWTLKQLFPGKSG